MSKRSDIHRPVEIAPSDYEYLFSFSYPSAFGEPGCNMALMAAVRTGETQQEPRYGISETGGLVVTGYAPVDSPWGKLPFFEKTTGSQAGCDVCGAYYRFGDAWLHRPSGEVICIGHICAGKMDLHADRGDWTRQQRELARLRKSAEYVKAKHERVTKAKAEAVTFLREHEGLEVALDTGHYISSDLKEKLWRYGSLSEKQVELAFRLQAQVAERAEEEAKVDWMMPPSGRQEVEGEVLTLKWKETDYGSTLKMLVLCGNGRKYKLWGTVPAAIDPERGDTVRFTARIDPQEEGFGFYSRPTKAEVVNRAKEQS